MSPAEFVHLRVRSAYSLSEGAIRIDQLAELCRAHAMPAVAVTDSGNLYGALEFATTMAKAGVQPIVGCTLAMRRPAGDDRPGTPTLPHDILPVLARSEVGYRNLLKLVSRAALASPGHQVPELGLADLADLSGGLIALTGGPKGTVGRLIGEGQAAAAEAALGELMGLFPGRLYVEVMRHGLAEEAEIEAALIALADRHGLPLVATNDAYFSDPDMYQAHDALLCIAQGKRVADTDRRRLTVEHRFKSPAEMRALFADLPDAIANSLAIAQRCAFMPEAREPILPVFPTATGGSEADALREQARVGLDARLQAYVLDGESDPEAASKLAEPYRRRLAYEMDVIVQMGFAGYFLIVAEFIQWAKGQGIPVGPGRGSGAGSVAAWALGITDLDPLRLGLLFERFLNPERVSMPDFDIDFCQDRRDEVIAHVRDKYGDDRVAQIVTFGKLQARAVVRDVGRVLGMPYGHVDRISKLVPYNPAQPVSLQQAIDREPQLQAMRESDEAVARLLDIALRLEGLYRHASTHAAGIVIADRPLEELVPLSRDPRSGMPVTQFSMKYVEQAGLVKFDFLGLKTLTVLVQARALLAARGVELDLLRLPLDDPKTYAMLGHGDTSGVFQLEGSGMRDMLRRLKPSRFEDIIAVVALYRPGPMENIPSYINRKHGQEKPDYLYPSLEPILGETYGIIIYQEQVMQIAQELSGFTLGAADLLRRAMGKKIKSEMAAQRQAFVTGAMARGVERARVTHIFDLVDKFAGYGFNKSHAAAYALVAYQTAYVKANYPVEFMAALMTHDMGNTDKLAGFRQELTRLDVALLPPDVQRSEVGFGVEARSDGSSAIRYALAAVKNVGRQAMAALVAERRARGPFQDIADFARRVDPHGLNKRQLENLIRAGAFDALQGNRAALLAGVDGILRQASLAAGERDTNQINLFAGAPETGMVALASVAPWTALERLKEEFEAIGFYLSSHPLDAYKQSLDRLGVTTAIDLPRRLGHGPARVQLAGTVIGKQERTNARGNRYAFLQLSDATGVMEVTLFAEILGAHRDLLEAGRSVLLTAEARLEGEALRITAQKIEDLDKAATRAAAGMAIRLADQAAIAGVRDVLGREGGGRSRVTLLLELDAEQRVELALPGGYAISPGMRAVLEGLSGVVEVRQF